MTTLDAEWIIESVKLIQNGFVDRLDKEGIIVYRCGTVIRIDIKPCAKIK